MTLLATLIAHDLRADPADPHWPDRDRLLLAAPTPSASTPASSRPNLPDGQWLEAPPGLAVGVAVGHAVAERLLAARFGRSLVDHRTWLVASRADLVCGAGQEGAHVAGALSLGRLAVLTTLPHDDQVLRAGFVAAGWVVRTIEARADHAAEAALSACLRAHKPTLILAIDTESSTSAALDASPDAPLHASPDAPRHASPDALRHASPEARRHASSPGARPHASPDAPRHSPPAGPLHAPQAAAPAPNPRGAAARRAWLKRLRRHANREAFQNALAGHLPPGWQKACHPDTPPQPPQSAIAELIAALTRLAPILPELATLPLSVAPLLPPPHIAAFPAAALDWEALDQAAPACLLGMSMHGGIFPVSRSPRTAALPRAAWRLAASQRARWLHTITHDRPAPPLPELAIANLHVYQPADPGETLDCLALALHRADGPSVLTLPADVHARLQPAAAHLNDPHPGDPRLSDPHLSAPRSGDPRQGDPPRPGEGGLCGPRSCGRGAYLVHAPPNRDVTLLAAGPALAAAAAVRALLAEHDLAAALVSMPCRALWDAQAPEYRRAVLGNAPIVAFAADALAFAGLTGPNDLIVGQESWPPDPHAIVVAILRHRRGT